MTSRQARVWVGVTALVTLVVVGAVTLTGRDDARTPEAAGTVAVAGPSASAAASAPPVVVPGRP
ncbi:DUF305 domain-containing protein, partial [Micromonospora provocatoris]